MPDIGCNLVKKYLFWTKKYPISLILGIIKVLLKNGLRHFFGFIEN